MPTRAEYMNYVLSLVGSYGAGAGHAENDVPFNTWYYGRHVAGSNWSWCRVGEAYVDNHFGMLAENGGKSAYVPANVRGRTARIWHRPKHGSAAYVPGNKVNLDFNHTGEAEHTEFYWKSRNSTSFWTVGFNTGNDQVAKRIRYFADVLDVLETVGFSTSNATKENDVPDYVSLTTKTSITVQPDQQFFVQFDKEITDKAKRSADTKPTPGIFTAGKNGSVYACNVDFAGPAVWELCEMRKDSDGSWKQHDHNVSGNVDLMDADGHLWLRVTPHAAGEVTVTVKCAIWDR